MPLSRRGHINDENVLGKRDDNYRPSGNDSNNQTWHAPRKSRIFFGLLAVVFLYLFFKNLPEGLTPARERYDPRLPGGFDARVTTRPYPPPTRPKDAGKNEPSFLPPRPSLKVSDLYYDGPIKFYYLANSLNAALSGADSRRNVLFAAANLKSVANILPIACDMALQERNVVHFAVMGRENVGIQEINQANGVTPDSCPISWHDARPDHSQFSTDARMESSGRVSLGHLQAFVRPQIVITDSHEGEDRYFTNSIVEKTNEFRLPLLEVPSATADSLNWLSKLDTSSLEAWTGFQMHILVQVPSDSAGSLIRLLRSLQSADFFGRSYPRLTIELPPKLDSAAKIFLDNFQWPPKANIANSLLTIRHRVDNTHLAPSQVSHRMAESFYPNSPHSHLLILSPQAELSPLFYHALTFSLLEYKYSSKAPNTAFNLFGISLVPTATQLDGKTPLQFETLNGDLPTPFFRIGAPLANAALYFADKWTEFHSFLSNLETINHGLEHATPEPKLVAETQPAWLEHMLQLARLRGYTMLYPSAPEGGKSDQPASGLATLHTDLYQPPEEFEKHRPNTDKKAETPQKLSDILTFTFPAPPSVPAEAPLTTSSSLLPHLFHSYAQRLDTNCTYCLPSLGKTPMYAFDGARTSEAAVHNSAVAYRREFGVRFGGCKSVEEYEKRAEEAVWEAGSADDLFCL